MRATRFLQIFTLLTVLFLCACVHPVSREAREHVSNPTTFAMVSENPAAFVDQRLVLGGVVKAVENAEEGSTLEIMEWRLAPWGEPLYLDDNGRRFLAKTSELIDPTIYEAGTLVTLTGVVLGSETRLLGEHEYDYPVFNITELHLLESPFRYDIHGLIHRYYPDYVEQNQFPHRHPYDPSYSPYPYTQYWYRNAGIY